MQFVLDCSVAISWCLVDENDNYANAILAMMPDSEAEAATRCGVGFVVVNEET